MSYDILKNTLKRDCCLCGEKSVWPNKAPLNCEYTFISDISRVNYNI